MALGRSPSAFFSEPSRTEMYTLSLHDALPILIVEVTQSGRTARYERAAAAARVVVEKEEGYGARVWLQSGAREPVELGRYLEDRKSTRLNSSHTVISYAVFCLKKKKDYVCTGD